MQSTQFDLGAVPHEICDSTRGYIWRKCLRLIQPIVRAGLAVSTAYQIAFTLPRWQQLVGSHLQRGGTSPGIALAVLAAFGAVIVTHTFVQVQCVCKVAELLLHKYREASALMKTLVRCGCCVPLHQVAPHSPGNAADFDRRQLLQRCEAPWLQLIPCLCYRAGSTARKAQWQSASSAPFRQRRWQSAPACCSAGRQHLGSASPRARHVPSSRLHSCFET